MMMSFEHFERYHVPRLIINLFGVDGAEAMLVSMWSQLGSGIPALYGGPVIKCIIFKTQSVTMLRTR